MKRSGTARSGSVINFRTTVKSGSVRRRSTLLPSLLTFLVIVASGGLLLMIEKGMLNSMDTPPPRGSGRRLDLVRQAGRPGSAAADVDSQVRWGRAPRGAAGRCGALRGAAGGRVLGSVQRGDTSVRLVIPRCRWW